MTDNRLVYVIVAVMFTYIGIEYILERRAAFLNWRSEFMAPFIKHPGRREFLHDVLVREEFNA